MFKHFRDKILNHKKVAVFSHVSPDGDCIGSQIGLCLWLKQNGVDTVAVNQDELPDNLQWMRKIFPIHKPTEINADEYDAFAFVDGNILYRFGELAESLSGDGRPFYMIDHHPDPEEVFEEKVSVTEKSSTCELVYDLYMEHDPSQVSPEIARALYTGIVTDTGSFQFDSVKPATMKAGSDLLDRGGFTPNEIVDRIYSTKTLDQLKLLSLALETIQTHADGQIATIYITKDMFSETQTTKEDTEGFVSYPLSIDTAKCCVLFREDDKGIKLSLRSRSEVDVNKWARKFNGGGHKKAAGAFHEGPLEKAMKEVVEAGKEQL
ncbi:DHH family phosphoesterase [Balneola sp. MJW-20]|uniref:DHH family phosphoesterase n=1 Tax=Gracilimonas aurantiaca TaxID=3234185 RepID=UPI0034670965